MNERRSRCVARERRSRFVEIFRTTPAQTVCPNFYVLAHANGCAFAPQCAYCYLKSSFYYLDGEHVFTNVDKLLEEVQAWIGRDRLESYMLNTGNLSDSLVFEEVRPVMGRLVELFRQEAEAKGRPHCLLLVTKGGLRECAGLLACPACRNVIVSFSLNHPDAARRYEAGAAPVDDRLAAAARLKARGWRVRIRIDPMIVGFDYTPVAEEVRRLGPERVTLGCLRAEPGLPRFIGNGVLAGLEKPAVPKGLARYPLDKRLALYRQVLPVLRGVCTIGLCEETPEVWQALELPTEDKPCNCGS